MVCERCNKKKVTVFYRESIGGRERAFRLCGECADALEEAGELEDVSASVAGFMAPRFLSDERRFLLPFHGAAAGDTQAEAVCSACGIAFREVAAAGQVGCAACYARFGGELERAIRSAHGRAEHAGRVSAGYRARQELEARLAGLKNQLKDAVSREDFESAAELRDHIRALEAEL